MNAVDKINEITDEYHQATKALTDKVVENFGKLAEEFFAEYPEVAEIRWDQYAPHFNDGEPCEFSVYDIMFGCHGFDIDPSDDDETQEHKEHMNEIIEDSDGGYPFTKFSWGTNELYNANVERYGEDRVMEIKAACDNLSNAISKIPDDVMRGMFGSDATVIIRHGEVIIEECYHD